MAENFLARIERLSSDLSRAEARVAAWVLAHRRLAADVSIAEVARAAGVSEPTVIRFCRSLGLAGFRDFRKHLIAALDRPDTYVHQDVLPSDALQVAVAKVMDRSIGALVDLRRHVAMMPFEAALTAMAKARQLVFVGLGASGLVATDASHKFFRLGIPCSAALDEKTIAQSAAVSEPADVYVAISHTGRWPELLRAMQRARTRGALVIVLTDARAPLAEAASLLFECHAAEDTSLFTPMSSRLAQLALLDALCVGLSLRLGLKAQENLRLSKEALHSALDVSL